MNSTHWVHAKAFRYLQICEANGVTPEATPSTLPHAERCSDKWIRNLFMNDYRLRENSVASELAAERGSSIWAMDWTKDAAARSSASFLFNVMDSDGLVLASKLTKNCSPEEVAPVLRALRDRGCRPKVIYVDDGCCDDHGLGQVAR